MAVRWPGLLGLREAGVMGRAVAAGAAFALAAASGVVTALAAADTSAALWAAFGVLVAGGAILQGWVTVAERRSGLRVGASGAGAVAVGGSAREVHTRVRGHGPEVMRDGPWDVAASGPGAVSVGGDTGPVTTDVAGAEGLAGQ
jgi:hypothetical protein